MSIPCPDTQPHRAHAEDNAHGICGGVPTPEAKGYASSIVSAAFARAEAACRHRFGDDPEWTAVEACRACITAAILDLSVFEPVLFPEETQ